MAYMVVAAMSTSGAQSDPNAYDEAMSHYDDTCGSKQYAES
jgi:hypothetical protein